MGCKIKRKSKSSICYNICCYECPNQCECFARGYGCEFLQNLEFTFSSDKGCVNYVSDKTAEVESKSCLSLDEAIEYYKEASNDDSGLLVKWLEELKTIRLDSLGLIEHNINKLEEEKAKLKEDLQGNNPYAKEYVEGFIKAVRLDGAVEALKQIIVDAKMEELNELRELKGLGEDV